MNRRTIFSMLKRWLDVIGYAFVPVLLLYLTREFLPAFLDKLAMPPRFLPVMFLGFTLVLWLCWIAGFRFGHFKTIANYPSFLIAVIIASIVLDYWIYPSKHVTAVFFGFPEIGFATQLMIISLLLTALLRTISQVFTTQSGIQFSPGSNLGNLQELSAIEIVQWASCEVPVVSMDQDLLKSQPRVDRILRFLRKPDRNTVALVGSYGAGKTSLLRMVANYALEDESPKLWFVSVSCWGFNDSAAAQEAVLTQIVKDLFDRADCFAIQGMPARFVEALSATSNYAKSVFHLAGLKDIDAQVSQISPILSACRARLVVVIEDTERGGATFDVACIAGLLNRFKDLPDVSFVINANPDTKIDFVRLCEHTETIPDLETETCISILSLVREHCRTKFPNDIDLVQRKKFFEREPWLAANKYGYWEFQMVKLVNTPRKLKATIRRFCDAWDVLHGEVDIDELLIACCLRICAPSIFGFLIRHYRDFPRLEKKSNYMAEDPKPLESCLRNEWSELKREGYDMLAVEALVQMLDNASRPIFDEERFRHTNLIQEFRSKDGDYQDRIINEALPEGGLKDQEVLCKIFKAKKENDWKDVAKQFEESEDFRRLFNRFSQFMLKTMLAQAELWAFVKEVFACIRGKYGPKASDDCPAYFDASQKVERCFSRMDEMYEGSFELVTAAVPHNLQLATDLFHGLIFNFSELSVKQVYVERFLNLLKKHFLQGEGVEVLNSGLDEALPATLTCILGAIHDSSSKIGPNWKDEWRWIGPILLKGLEKHKDKFAPQISIALGMSIVLEPLPSGFLVNDPILDGVFGSQAQQVMVHLSKPFKIHPLPEKLVPGNDLTVVNHRAAEWLKRKEKP